MSSSHLGLIYELRFHSDCVSPFCYKLDYSLCFIQLVEETRIHGERGRFHEWWKSVVVTGRPMEWIKAETTFYHPHADISLPWDHPKYFEIVTTPITYVFEWLRMTKKSLHRDSAKRSNVLYAPSRCERALSLFRSKNSCTRQKLILLARCCSFREDGPELLNVNGFPMALCKSDLSRF